MFSRAITDLANDPALRARLAHDPHGVAREYGLEPGQIATLVAASHQGATPEDARGFAPEYVGKVSKIDSVTPSSVAAGASSVLTVLCDVQLGTQVPPGYQIGVGFTGASIDIPACQAAAVNISETTMSVVTASVTFATAGSYAPSLFARASATADWGLVCAGTMGQLRVT